MHTMIRIKKSPTADTRTCDWSKVTKVQLYTSSLQHICDVGLAMRYFANAIDMAANRHDHTKLSQLDQFHADFATGFKSTIWWDNHRKDERHHLGQPDGVRADVDLIDVLEYIADCVMAGMARTGNVYDIEIEPEVLKKAFKNTCEKLKAKVQVEE